MYKTFLFDLDGTLTDPKEGIVNSVLYALKKVGIEEVHISELDSFIGPPIQQSFIERYNMSEGEVERAVFYFREYLKQRGLFENNVYEGILKLLQQLKKFRESHICSNFKAHCICETSYRAFSINELFRRHHWK